MPKSRREEIRLERGEEIIIRSEGRSFIVRGTLHTLQVFSLDYLRSSGHRLFAGTTHGIVVGHSFSVGYEKDVKPFEYNIPMLQI